MTQAMAAYIPQEIPKSSIAIKQQAIGVFAEAENTATNPIPARRLTGSGKTRESALPSVAPMKNSGVTSPPLKPKPNVTAVRKILSKKS